MNEIPDTPYIYHITHVNNLSSIIEKGGLWSDASMVKQCKPKSSIGMGEIKERRFELPVKCYPDDFVADYVPFYFCPRSIMLYVIYSANHPELTYRDGQEPIIHLEAELYRVIDWAKAKGQRWAFTLSNAGAYLTEFRNRLEDLNELDWDVIAAEDFRDRQVSEGKQAEFLVYGFFPWHLIQRIGVYSSSIRDQVFQELARTLHSPTVEILRHWYF